MSENRSLQSAIANHSEDETFKLLRRVPIDQLDPIFRERFWEFYSDDKKFRAWLDSVGWEKDDFFREGSEFEATRRSNLRKAEKGNL